MPGGVGVVGAALGGCLAGGGGGGGVRVLQAGSFEVVVVWEALIEECFDCYRNSAVRVWRGPKCYMCSFSEARGWREQAGEHSGATTKLGFAFTQGKGRERSEKRERRTQRTAPQGKSKQLEASWGWNSGTRAMRKPHSRRRPRAGFSQ